MPTFGSIDFDNAILNALRDDKLVVFAGAGISKGAPSNLPLFDELADAIGKNTGQGRDKGEPVDRFLGRLTANVHEIAKEKLTPDGSKPNPIHYDLLKLFADSAKVRIVTTNFDLHFETAAQDLIQKKFFQTPPEIYRAPALPLGNRFNGVVHVHGALPTAADLVLTDADFGRAYLIEGWARRFLVEMFREYTVLFVGYSHSDVVMNYLARALPPEQKETRFALATEPGKWDSLGIKPIIYNKENDNHQALYDGIRKFAEYASRGAMSWRTWLAQHCADEPPLLDEAIAAQVDLALQEKYTTRLFTKNARHPGWLKWLADRGHLSAIFGQEELSAEDRIKDRLLANWLVWNYAIEHSDELFTMAAKNEFCLNPYLWNLIGFRLGRNDAESLDSSAMRHWVMAYLSFAPKAKNHWDQHVITSLAEQCAQRDMIDLVLNIFLHAGEYHCKVRPHSDYGIIDKETPGGDISLDWSTCADDGDMRDIWIKLLNPRVDSIAQPLISGIYSQINGYYRKAAAWESPTYSYNFPGQHRPAIEDHEQNRFPKVIDVLINAMRDALTWLLRNAPAEADAWIENLMNSDAILLQRIAIHAMGDHPRKSADERLEWLVARAPLFREYFSNDAHHEVYQFAAKSYLQASPAVRKSLVNAILAYRFPADESRSAEDAEKSTAWRHYNWLEWLSRTDAGCPLLQKHLSLITDQYPKWEPSEHPDFLISWGEAGFRGAGSPSGVEKLLTRPASEQIDELVNFKGEPFRGPDREDLLADIRKVCEKNPSWGLGLVKELAARNLWEADLWERAFTGLRKADLKQDDWRVLLQVISAPELQIAQPREIAFLLQSLVEDGGKHYAMGLLEIANRVALAIWNINVDDDDSQRETPDWVGRAINEPAGMMIEFWLDGLSLLLRGKSGDERKMPEHYREWFNMAIEDDSPKGGMARCLLASQVSFFWGLDETWTRERIIPLFSDDDSARFLQAWHGFITWGRLMLDLADALKPGFLVALTRLSKFTENRREAFFRIFTWLVTMYEDAPGKELMPAMNEHSNESDREILAEQIRFILQELPPDSKRELWKRWLCGYWQNRWEFGDPSPPTPDENGKMLEWLPHLGDAYPEAISVIEKSSFDIGRYYLSSPLDKSGLIKQYPNETAQLLIHLCRRTVSDSYHIPNIVRLLPPILDEELKHKLNECLIKIRLDPLD